MALRNQPYIPLYIQDYLTDEKLNMCSAATQGVFIKIMCVMHKSDEYGKILLKQKDKQTDKQINNFALKLAKLLPFTFDIILHALNELLDEKVLFIEGDSLCQKRMIKDEKISLLRAKAGSKGGKKTQLAKEFAKAKNKASSEYEYEYEYENALKGKERKEKNIPEFKEFSEYSKTITIYHPSMDFQIQAKYNAWKENNWKDGNNKQIKNWKTKLQNTMPYFKINNNGNIPSNTSYRDYEDVESPTLKMIKEKSRES